MADDIMIGPHEPIAKSRAGTKNYTMMVTHLLGNSLFPS
jgi:hypothetical protein